MRAAAHRRRGIAFGLVLGLLSGAYVAPGSHAAGSAAPGSSPAASASAPLAPQILEMPVKDSPVVALRVLIPVGSADDPSGKEGLCNLAMRAAAEGGTPSLTQKEVADLLYPMAASVRLEVDKEAVVFETTVRRADLDTMIPVFFDLIFRPRYAAEDIARVRENTLGWLRNELRGGNDEQLGKAGLEARLFRNTRWAHPAAGTESGIQGIEDDDLRAFHDAAVDREGVVVGIAGGFEPAAVGELRSLLSRIAPGQDGDSAGETLARPRLTADVPADPPGSAELLLIEKPEARATAVSIGFLHDVHRSDPDYVLLLLATTALGEHRTFHGRLQNRMRSARGLNYGDYAYLDAFDQDSWSRFNRPNLWREIPHFSIWIRPVQPANGPFAVRQALWEMRRWIEQGLTPEEFETSRDHLRNVSQLWRQTLQRRLGFAIDARHEGIEGDVVESMQRALETVTREQVNEALRRRLSGHEIGIVMVCAHADSIRAIMTSDEDTPIVYSGGSASEEIRAEDAQIRAMPFGIVRSEIVPAEEMFE
ncbi:MAG: M16 family metallopeptidase [Candidatus Eisenbacteria bacterium]